MKQRVLRCLWAGIVAGSGWLHAGTILWGNDARLGNSHLESFDALTGAMLTSFVAPNPGAAGHIGRGIAVVGSNIYYSVDDSGDVFLTNPGGTDLGVAFSTGLPGIGAIASDGSYLYIAPTGGSMAQNQQVLQYTFGGALVNTLTLTPSSGGAFPLGRTGLETFAGGFVGNQGNNEGPYDRFDGSGTLLTPSFLHTSTFGFSGVAFDGSVFYVVDEESLPSILREFDAAGNAIGTVTLGCPGPNQQCDLQDLSTVVTGVPEPMGLGLAGIGLLAIGVMRRIRR